MSSLDELSTLSGLSSASFADVVFNRYAQRLLGVARQRLGTRLRAKVSEEDIVQSAMKSFFRRREEFHFSDDNADGLWALLVVITLRKCTKWADVFSADKRAAEREMPLGDGGSQWRELSSREPTPEEAALLAELVEQLMQPLEARQQQMLLLRMQGYEVEEIAADVGSSKRTVARVVAEAKVRLQRLLEKAHN